MTERITRRPGGVIVPVLTTVSENGAVDEQAMRQLIRRCLAAGVDGIFVGGSAGMGPMLLENQWEKALDVALEEVSDKALVLAGVIATSTQRALLQIKASQRLGCSTIVVTPTYYIALKREDEMLAHFEACRNATDQEMVVYNIPSCTGSSIPPAVIGTAAARGWTHAVKESSGDRDYFKQVLDAVKEHDVAVLQGNEPDIAWGLELGAAGIVPVCANCEPETFVSAVQAARDRDWSELQTLQKRIDEVRDTILVGDHNWISGLCCALNLLGIGEGRPLLPLQDVDEARRRRMMEFFATTVG